jgi:hypothetical protein
MDCQFLRRRGMAVGVIPPSLLDLIEKEMESGEKLYGPFKSKSHAYAVLLGEMLDLHWYLKREEMGQGNADMEWAQVASVALRALAQFTKWSE